MNPDRFSNSAPREFNYKELNYGKSFPHMLSVTSGKGGVGKTLTTVNLALAAQKSGLNTLILDGDMGLANVDIVLGLKAGYNILDVFDGNKTLEEIALEGPAGIRVIPSGSGIASLSQLSDIQKACLKEQLSEYSREFDLVIIDTGAGINDNTVHLNSMGDQIVIVTTPEPHAMADAYALMKVMSQTTGRKSGYGILVNMTRFEDEGKRIYSRLKTVAQRFLDVDPEYLGSVPVDPSLIQSIKTCSLGSNNPSSTLSGQAWNRIMLQGIHNRIGFKEDNVIWDRLFGPVQPVNMQIA